MCQRCVDACRLHFPDCPDEVMGDFLSGATCYPLGGPEDVERQLVEAKEAGCATYLEAMAYADEQTTKHMQEYSDADDCAAIMRL